MQVIGVLRRYGGRSSAVRTEYRRDGIHVLDVYVSVRRPVNSALVLGLRRREGPPERDKLASLLTKLRIRLFAYTTYRAYHRVCMAQDVPRPTATAVTDALRCFCEQMVRVHRQ
jgi:hypothetical protein